MAIKLLSKTGIGMFLSVGLPIAYMITQHIKWMEDKPAKWRMALKHAGFWTGLLGTVVLGHKVAFPLLHQRNWLGGISTLLVGATLPILGYEGLRRVSKVVFPKPKDPATDGLLSDNLVMDHLGGMSVNPSGQVEFPSVSSGLKGLAPQWHWNPADTFTPTNMSQSTPVSFPTPAPMPPNPYIQLALSSTTPYPAYGTWPLPVAQPQLSILPQPSVFTSPSSVLWR